MSIYAELLMPTCPVVPNCIANLYFSYSKKTCNHSGKQGFWFYLKYYYLLHKKSSQSN